MNPNCAARRSGLPAAAALLLAGSSAFAGAPVAYVIDTYAGTGAGGFSGDGGPATSAQIASPRGGVYRNTTGDLYIMDNGNDRIRSVSSTGVISTYAGTGVAGYSGDGGLATSAQINGPRQGALDALDRLLFSDEGNHVVRQIDPTSGIITTVAGTGVAGFTGDGGPATSAQLDTPLGVWAAASGAFYVSDSGNSRVRRVNSGGIITTYAGSGAVGCAGDGGTATSAQLDAPFGLTGDALGNLFIAVDGCNRVRRVDFSTGIITTYAGTGGGGYSGDGGAATSAQVSGPRGVFYQAGSGWLFIAEDGNEVIRVVDGSGVIWTVAGTGTVGGFAGDGGPATSALLNRPETVAFSASGLGYISDRNNNRVRRLQIPLSPTPTATVTVTATETVTATSTATASPTITCPVTLTLSCTVWSTNTSSPTSTPSPTRTVSGTVTETATRSGTTTRSATRTTTATVTRTATVSGSPTTSGTATGTFTVTPTPAVLPPAPGTVGIYPNPVSGSSIAVAFLVTEPSNAYVDVYGASARLLATVSTTGLAMPGPVSFVVVDVSAVPPGVYYAVVRLKGVSGFVRKAGPSPFVVVR